MAYSEVAAETAQPLVSVMMPAFNVEALLPAALDSLIAQSYRNWEAVVVDDGSTDGTAGVLRKYAAHEPRIRPIFSPHGGRGLARNTSLEHCRGDFIALLDSDDLALPDRLEKQVQFLSQYPEFGAVSGQCVSFAGEPVIDLSKLMPWPTDPDEISDSLKAGRMRILNGAAMLRRQVFDQFGGYRVELRRAQDYEFFRRLALGGVRLGATRDIAILYRQDRLIPTFKYYLESEMYRHYANELHGGYDEGFETFCASGKGRMLSAVTRARYGYLFVKLALRYRRIR